MDDSVAELADALIDCATTAAEKTGMSRLEVLGAIAWAQAILTKRLVKDVE